VFKNDGNEISASTEQQYRKPLLCVKFTFFKKPKNCLKFQPYKKKRGIQAIKDTKYNM
jgi:hypothetical protein